MAKTRREHIVARIKDLVADFLYYDRKEDEELPRGAIEEATDNEEISANEIVECFRTALYKGLDIEPSMMDDDNNDYV